MAEESSKQELLGSDEITNLESDVTDEPSDTNQKASTAGKSPEDVSPTKLECEVTDEFSDTNHHVTTDDKSPEDDSGIGGNTNVVLENSSIPGNSREEDSMVTGNSVEDYSNVRGNPPEDTFITTVEYPVVPTHEANPTPPLLSSPSKLKKIARGKKIKMLHSSIEERRATGELSICPPNPAPPTPPDKKFSKEDYTQVHIRPLSAKPEYVLQQSCMCSLWDAFICTAVGCVFFVYLLGGATMFYDLEGKQEDAQLEYISRLKNDTAILLATELRQVRAHEPVWAQYVFKHLDIFEENLLKSIGVGYWRQKKEEGQQRWSKPSALFYSFSLMTRTGYGSMTPKSEWGRTATVCFSLFAIPVTLTWFILSGRFLANIFSWFLNFGCCEICILGKKTCCKSNGKSNKVIRTRSNSIGPIEQVEKTSMSKRSVDSRNKKWPQPRPYNVDKRKLLSMKHAVCIVFSVILFIVYFVIGSAMLAIYEDLNITDALYFNFLMFQSLGPGCMDLEDDMAEIRIKTRMGYFWFLYIGYSILSMILTLIYTFYFPSNACYWARRKKKVVRHFRD